MNYTMKQQSRRVELTDATVKEQPSSPGIAVIRSNGRRNALVSL